MLGALETYTLGYVIVLLINITSGVLASKQ